MFFPRILFKFSDGDQIGHHYIGRTVEDIHLDILFYLQRDANVEWEFLT